MKKGSTKAEAPPHNSIYNMVKLWNPFILSQSLQRELSRHPYTYLISNFFIQPQDIHIQYNNVDYNGFGKSSTVQSVFFFHAAD